MFSSVEFCAYFWQILLKALDTEVTKAYMKSNGFAIENCKRKHGFVGMLSVSCKVGDNIQVISVDITPSIVSDNLGGYTALLRPRHYDNKEVGEEFYQGLELSSASRDWNFLKFLEPEVMCAYALVKMLRSLAETFQTHQGRIYTAEDILPSYMLKTALLWILDPQDKRSDLYKNLDISSVLKKEESSSYKAAVFALCQDLLKDPDGSCLDIWEMNSLLDIWEKCTAGDGNLTVRERTLPYVLAAMYGGRDQQNGINLLGMEENCNLDTGGISHHNEVIYNRMLHTDPESTRVWIEHKSNNKPVRQLSHHPISYPDISEETASKCQVWALRMLRLLPHLLQYDMWIHVGRERTHVIGLRNYYLPDQEIYCRDKDLTIALCRVLEAVLE